MKKKRGRKKLTRSERKQRSRGTSAVPVVVEERAKNVPAEEREEACYIRFGLPPKEGGSVNTLFQSQEAGVSAFRGRKLISAGKTSYTVEITDPDEGGSVADALLQAQTLINVIFDNRPVLALSGGEEVGLGGDGEPVVSDCVSERISPLAQIRLPEWWEAEGRTFEQIWNEIRRTPKLRTSPTGRAAAQQRLLPASQKLMDEIHARITRRVACGGASEEDEEKLLAISESIVSTDKKAPSPFISKKLQRHSQRERETVNQYFQPATMAATGEGVAFVEEVLAVSSTASKNSQIHGPGHWKRVAVAGHELLRETPEADPVVVLRFALCHDMMRYSDSTDPGHGRRGAAMAEKLFAKELCASQLEVLKAACAEHEEGRITHNPTAGLCWDADRLNLWRVGKQPAPGLLSTPAAKERIEWARDLQREKVAWPEIFELYGEACQ